MCNKRLYPFSFENEAQAIIFTPEQHARVDMRFLLLEGRHGSINLGVLTLMLSKKKFDIMKEVIYYY